MRGGHGRVVQPPFKGAEDVVCARCGGPLDAQGTATAKNTTSATSTSAWIAEATAGNKTGPEGTDPRTTQAVATLSHAAALLAQAEDPEGFIRVGRLAEAARVLAEQLGLGADAENAATEIRLLAEIRLADVVKRGQEAGQIERHGGDRRSKVRDADLERLTDLGVDRRRLAEGRLLAANVGEVGVRELISEAARKREPLSRSAVLRFAARRRDAERQERDGPTEWTTPPEIIERALGMWARIDVDPYADDAHSVPAAAYYTRADNGLAKHWYGAALVNPEYDDIEPWVVKAIEEYTAGRSTGVILVLPVRTDAAWWPRLHDHPFCLLRRRLHFGGARTAAPFTSALFYLGPDATRFAAVFADLGDTFLRLQPQDGAEAQ